MQIKTKYIAKPQTWFKAGSEAKLIVYQYTDADIFGKKYGLFRGTYIIGDSDYDKFWISQGFETGMEIQMNEVCCYDEFIIEELQVEDQ